MNMNIKTMPKTFVFFFCNFFNGMAIAGKVNEEGILRVDVGGGFNGDLLTQLEASLPYRYL